MFIIVGRGPPTRTKSLGRLSSVIARLIIPVFSIILGSRLPSAGWRTTALSRQFDPRMMTGRSGETPIAREQWSVERLGEGHIDGVIGRKIVP